MNIPVSIPFPLGQTGSFFAVIPYATGGATVGAVASGTGAPTIVVVVTATATAAPSVAPPGAGNAVITASGSSGSTPQASHGEQIAGRFAAVIALSVAVGVWVI